jgi:uncharacterized protein (DUF2344 family)
MGQSHASCDCAAEDQRPHLESYIDLPSVTREDVDQIWKCFEYLNPKNGKLGRQSLLDSQKTSPGYMNELLSNMLSLDSDVSFDEFFNIMKPRITALKKKNESVLLENNTTNVSCIICPYKARSVIA